MPSDGIGPENPRGDTEGRDRIDELFGEVAKLNQTYIKFNQRVMRIIIGICVMVVVSLAIGGLLVIANSNRVSDIQASRLESCLDTNSRHENTLSRFNDDINRDEAIHPNKRVQDEQARVETTALIDALAPVRNCRNLVKGG